MIHHPQGHYHFLKGIAPYSCGVVSEPGHEIVHVTLRRPIPWREGFDRIDAYLQSEGRSRAALCGIQYRCPAPFTMEGFIAFNRQYCSVLEGWDLYVDGINPVARTNVAAAVSAPQEVVLYAFSHTRPNIRVQGSTFVVAGAGELLDGLLNTKGIVRRGETSSDAIREKSAYVIDVMADRLLGLGATWEQVNRVNLYTIHDVRDIVEEMVVPKSGAAACHGVHWYPSRPPVVDLEVEMDMRGVACEMYLDIG